jgi:hypothetical protein
LSVPDVQAEFLRKLYDLSDRKITPIDRHDVGKKLKLSNDETDAVVTELEAAGKINKLAGTMIMLTIEGINETK